MQTSKFKIILLVLILSALGITILLTRSRYTLRTSARADIPEAVMVSPTPTIYQTTEVIDSPDGLKLVTMKSEEKEGIVTYSFFSSNKDEALTQPLYTTESSTTKYAVPFNTWSPDNKYFFIKEINSDSNNYYVFSYSGELFGDIQYLNVQKLFNEKVEGYVIKDVTGWASETLLIVNAENAENNRKVSFWFEIPTQSFIQLGTYFE